MAVQNGIPFSPLETPSIFATKWFHKIDQHVTMADYQTNDAWVDWTTKGYELFMAFRKQGAALHFDQQTISAVPVACGRDGDKVGDAWNAAEKLRDVVNWSIDEGVQSLRHAGRSMPEVKYKFDILVDNVTLAIVDGTWDGEISKLSQKVIEKIKGAGDEGLQ
ncbi:hypothetical protein CBER1_03574 [Cercospora berteroae]|uniref:Uncharacterized protein n=1 Tax=Cercospora berteroae TaxID=357750 RepID=A0A2S6C885_9PEZI|nr:hypothetical protein CBER1_03574 [Cercospora berteroae]